MKRKLAQSRPTTTTAAAIRTVTDASDRFTVDWINVCNVSASAATFRVFDAGSGADLDEDTALSWNVSVPAGGMEMIPGPFYFWQTGQQLGIRTSVANALNFTVYGEIA
jgi:hypothetical protein